MKRSSNKKRMRCYFIPMPFVLGGSNLIHSYHGRQRLKPPSGFSFLAWFILFWGADAGWLEQRLGFPSCTWCQSMSETNTGVSEIICRGFKCVFVPLQAAQPGGCSAFSKRIFEPAGLHGFSHAIFDPLYKYKFWHVRNIINGIIVFIRVLWVWRYLCFNYTWQVSRKTLLKCSACKARVGPPTMAAFISLLLVMDIFI